MRKKTANLPAPGKELPVLDVEWMKRRRDHLESKLPEISPVDAKELARLYEFFRIHG